MRQVIELFSWDFEAGNAHIVPLNVLTLALIPTTTPSRRTMIVSGPDTDTKVGDIVSMQVPNAGPYGMVLVPDRDGQGAVIEAWGKMFDGKYGPIQRHKVPCVYRVSTVCLPCVCVCVCVALMSLALTRPHHYCLTLLPTSSFPHILDTPHTTHT